MLLDPSLCTVISAELLVISFILPCFELISDLRSTSPTESRELMEKQKIQEILEAQNASIDADMRKGKAMYLLQQTEIIAHFAKGSQSASEKKPCGRDRHASKVTEEEEDEVYLKKGRI